MSAAQTPALVPIGDNSTRLWGLTARERLRRIAAAQGLTMAEQSDDARVEIDLRYAFDPLWLKYAVAHPGVAITRGGVPAIAHVEAGRTAADCTAIPQETTEIENAALRKRERPFLEPLTPATVPQLERESYAGAYKGVTDLLTKYLWPEWAFHLTRLAARLGVSPNQVTAVGAAFCVAATILFWHGWYWTGMMVAGI